jgi:hypothetical protein
MSDFGFQEYTTQNVEGFTISAIVSEVMKSYTYLK